MPHQKKANPTRQAIWSRENRYALSMSLYKNTDGDIIDHLENNLTIPKTTYIKMLIRQDIEQHKDKYANLEWKK